MRGSSESELKTHHLSRDPDAYFYTRQGKSSKVNTINDGSDHKATNSAFKTLGFSASEIDAVWNVVAAILHLVSKESFQIYIKCPMCYLFSGSNSSVSIVKNQHCGHQQKLTWDIRNFWQFFAV